MPFEVGNKAAVGSGGPVKNKPYRDALRIEQAAIENGEICVAPVGSLRWIARQQFVKAGEDTSAAKEIADRLDGKVPTPVVGGDDDDPAIKTISRIELIGVRPPDQDT